MRWLPAIRDRQSRPSRHLERRPLVPTVPSHCDIGKSTVAVTITSDLLTAIRSSVPRPRHAGLLARYTDSLA
jgi:hypothetical protein